MGGQGSLSLWPPRHTCAPTAALAPAPLGDRSRPPQREPLIISWVPGGPRPGPKRLHSERLPEEGVDV